MPVKNFLDIRQYFSALTVNNWLFGIGVQTDGRNNFDLSEEKEGNAIFIYFIKLRNV